MCWEWSEEASEGKESAEEGRLSRASNWSKLCASSERKMRRKASKSTSSSSADALPFSIKLHCQHSKPPQLPHEVGMCCNRCKMSAATAPSRHATSVWINWMGSERLMLNSDRVVFILTCYHNYPWRHPSRDAGASTEMHTCVACFNKGILHSILNFC